MNDRGDGTHTRLGVRDPDVLLELAVSPDASEKETDAGPAERGMTGRAILPGQSVVSHQLKLVLEPTRTAHNVVPRCHGLVLIEQRRVGFR